MKQLIQNYRTGKIELADVPIPLCGANSVLVKNQASLISIGTEKSIIELGRKSLLGKAKARPDLVKRFIEKAKKEGFWKTFQEALGRLDNPTPLGYSSAGVVVEVGKNVHKFSVGDRVACIGAGYACHAEYITVPENLCVRLPDNVSFEEGAFGMLGIIALHGIRCANLTFGEKTTVIGLGLIGLLTIQILNTYGSQVIGFDIDPAKVELARSLGLIYGYSDLEDFKNAVDKLTHGFGADAVIITAATKSDEPVNVAVDIARMKAKIVMVGVGDIHPNRNEMWHKEVEIVVSKAGGPGIFDPFYENKGIDYPIGYVRWTENRNLEEFIRLIAEKRVEVKKLISHIVPIEDALQVYEDLLSNSGKYVGVIIKYPEGTGEVGELERIKILKKVQNSKFEVQDLIEKREHKVEGIDKVRLGVIGAGLFGKALLLPALKKINDAELYALCTSSAPNVYHTGKKYGFSIIATDYNEILKDESIDAVIILTPHSQHKKMVIDALIAGKHVFVEKPLCISEEELLEIDEVYRNLEKKPVLMVGYNRRFSKHSEKVKQFLGSKINPSVINYRVNAGFVPPDHWVHSEEEGGSRIVGEICHFIDMLIYLTNSYPVKVFAERVRGDNRSVLNSDNISITLSFNDGSIGSIIYSASGDKAFSRELVEVFCDGKTAVIQDYRKSETFFNGRRKKFKTMNQDMGYGEELRHFVALIKGKENPRLRYEEIYYSTLTIFKIIESLQKGLPINI